MIRRRRVRLIREGFPEPAALDTAVSRAILMEASRGEAAETLRLHRPAPIVAFGPKDRLEPGYREAVAAARVRGFASVQRLAGGRAAIFHEQTIAFSWAIPDPTPREGIRSRFEEVATTMAAAFRSLAVDARVGEVPGEYCPGEYSVNARGRTKLMGVGQRVVAGAAHVGGVVVVADAGRTRDVLVAVYEALGLAWDPATVGSLEDEAPGVTWDSVEAAIADAFAARYDIEEGRLEARTLELAAALTPAHAVEPVPDRIERPEQPGFGAGPERRGLIPSKR